MRIILNHPEMRKYLAKHIKYMYETKQRKCFCWNESSNKQKEHYGNLVIKGVSLLGAHIVTQWR